MLNIADIFEEIIDTFDDGTLAEQEFVGQIHELVFHVFANFRDQVNVSVPEFGEQFRRHIALVGEQLAEKVFGQVAHDVPVFVVHIGGGDAEREYFAPVVDDDMELEPVKPASAAFAPFCQVGKHFVRVYPPVVAYVYRCAVRKIYARALAKTISHEV